VASFNFAYFNPTLQLNEMNIESFRNYCLSKKGVTEEFPFGQETLVYKVMGKMFALTDFLFESINLKCDPVKAVELREEFPAVQPGYHMNKKHWNTIIIDGSLSDQLIYSWTDDSYRLVVEGLPKAKRSELERLNSNFRLPRKGHQRIARIIGK
jgi:predicted DNA-binding protein (MmcQ/YjbR family)